MRLHLAAAAALLAGSTVALAQDADQSTATQASSASAGQTGQNEIEEENPGDEIVCRRERVTGSLTRVRRTCLTRNEWNLVEANTRDGMIQSGRNASGSQCINTDPMRPNC